MPDRNANVRESFYSRLFARFYDPFMQRMEERVLYRYRQRLLSGLSGDILEVGSGTGINFPLYPRDCRVIASEPSEHMLHFAQERLRTSAVKAEILPVKAGVGSEQLRMLIPEGGLDAIVCTLVLCTIPDPAAAVHDFKQWLKQDGQLIVLEHVHSSAQPRRMIHNLLNPAWKVLAEGCHLTRDTATMLRNEGFVAVAEERFTKVLPFYVAVMRKA